MLGGGSDFFVNTRSSNDGFSSLLYLLTLPPIVNCKTSLLHCPTLAMTSISLQFIFLQLKSNTKSILPSLLNILSKHLITSLCISLCSSVPHVFVLSGTYVTMIFLFLNSSILIVTPITFILPSPYFTSSTHKLSQTIITTPPPLPFLSLLQLLYPSLKLTWISALSFVSTMHITSTFSSFKYPTRWITTYLY
ncbi:hypothetical protein E2C01_059508 [Portunus trituberculatus]|uniref:Uncharacterized protein n=1 Tax=Portunus trituberculatus TaxID=210409 RepID=A0A5B7H993_PORTR|nr:hypothetical protein [Portunus trituberculatus]